MGSATLVSGGGVVRVGCRHMMLLADVMTFKGEVLGITRYARKRLLSAAFAPTHPFTAISSVCARCWLLLRAPPPARQLVARTCGVRCLRRCCSRVIRRRRLPLHSIPRCLLKGREYSIAGTRRLPLWAAIMG